MRTSFTPESSLKDRIEAQFGRISVNFMNDSVEWKPESESALQGLVALVIVAVVGLTAWAIAEKRAMSRSICDGWWDKSEARMECLSRHGLSE